jgi:hypothetical protein
MLNAFKQLNPFPISPFFAAFDECVHGKLANPQQTLPSTRKNICVHNEHDKKSFSE